jgi:ribonuclease E
LVRDRSGITDSGRAVNDPRLSPRQILETQIVTEQAPLFALPEAPPVSIIQQDTPRASNDPRGPREETAVAD